MSSNKFRFEALLKLRENERTEKKNAFLTAQNRLTSARAELARRERELAEYQNETKTLRATSVFDAIALRRRQEYQKKLAERRDEAQNRVDELARNAEICRGELNEAVKEAKILQQLKEKTDDNRRDEERRRAEKELDELASQQKLVERRRQRAENDEN